MQIEVSSGGAPGASSSHAASTSARALAGYDAKNQAARVRRRGTKWIAVTTAKLPPPPRSAQKRSASPRTRRRSPFAPTTSNALTRSSVSPSARPASPMPPPVASPPSATFGHEPDGSAIPRRPSRR